jgi:hypothetical protein
MSHCVYWIREQSHTDLMSQGYIGVSGNVDERFESHKGMYSGTNNYLCNAIKKYGWDNLVKSVLVFADKDYCFDIERKLRPADQIGWNLVMGGGKPPIIRGPRPELRGRPSWNKGMVGCLSDETREKMRLARLGKPPANKGVPLAQERIDQLRQINLGNTYRLGKKMPPHVVELSRTQKLGTKHSEETKAKMSAAHMGKKKQPFSDEHKRKLGLNAKGRKWYNNGTNIVFCLEGQQPEGYVLGRKCCTLVKEY